VGIILGILNAFIVVLCVFLIGVILIQRGKGGGLAGAFGGVGGSSAFGTKAGDVFTRITVGIAIAWILLAMLMVVLTNRRNESAWGSDSSSALSKALGSAGRKTSKGSDSTSPGKPGSTTKPSSSAPSTTIPAEAPLPSDLPAIPAIPEPSGSPAPAPAPAPK
jgi:preprotein translocase subunit SecG